MDKVTTSIKVDPKLWTEVKVHVAKAGVKISEYIEGLIKKDLKKK